MFAPLPGPLIVTQNFASLKGGPGEAYIVNHDGIEYFCRGHPGYDFSCPVGTPVFAMKGGIAHFYGTPWGYPDDGYGPLGLHAVVLLPNGEAHWYGHLSQSLIGEKGNVVQGQQFALSGNTGNVIGTGHLHVAWRPPKPNFANGADGFEDYFTHFDADVYPRIDLSSV